MRAWRLRPASCDVLLFDVALRVVPIAAVALTGALLLACSSSATPSDNAQKTDTPAATSNASPSAVATGTVPDPCSLVTADQVRTITGEDPGTPSSTRSGTIFPTERTCSWDPVITFVGDAGDFQNFKATVEHDFGPVQPVQGVGLDAFWDPEGKAMVARGQRFFVAAELSGMGSTDSDATQMARCKQLLAIMLGNV